MTYQRVLPAEKGLGSERGPTVNSVASFEVS